MSVLSFVIILSIQGFQVLCCFSFAFSYWNGSTLGRCSSRGLWQYLQSLEWRRHWCGINSHKRCDAYEQVNLRGLPFLLLLSQIYHSLAQRTGLQRLLAKDCQSIYDFILYKVGIRHSLSFLSRCEIEPRGLRACFRKHDSGLEKEHNAGSLQVLFFHRHFALVVQRVVWVCKAAKQ